MKGQPHLVMVPEPIRVSPPGALTRRRKASVSRSLYARTRLQRTARLRRQATVRRVLSYLDTQKYAERDPWLADDIYVARTAVAQC